MICFCHSCAGSGTAITYLLWKFTSSARTSTHNFCLEEDLFCYCYSSCRTSTLAILGRECHLGVSP